MMFNKLVVTQSVRWRLCDIPVTIVTHAVHKSLVEHHGLTMYALDGDPEAIVRSTAFRDACHSKKGNVSREPPRHSCMLLMLILRHPPVQLFVIVAQACHKLLASRTRSFVTKNLASIAAACR